MIANIALALKELERKWPQNLMLFAAASTLLLVDRHTGRVISHLNNILCDGGDPSIVEVHGDAYIEHIYLKDKS